MCVAGAALRLLSLLQFHEDVEMKQSILRTLSELTNTTTANALLEAKVLKICLDFISNEQSQIGLVLSAMRVLVNLASAPSSSVVMVNEVMPILFTAFAGPFSSSIQLLQMIAACVANLAHHRRCVALLCKTKVPHTLCDLGTLPFYSFILVCFRILIFLHLHPQFVCTRNRQKSFIV
jgi:hypothetical protein